MKSVATLQLGYKVGIKKPSYYPISTNIEEKLGKTLSTIRFMMLIKR